jgi:hypothetical protein
VPVYQKYMRGRKVNYFIYISMESDTHTHAHICKTNYRGQRVTEDRYGWSEVVERERI